MTKYALTYLEVPIFFSKLSGFHKHSNNLWRKFMIYILTPLQLIIHALILYELENTKKDLGRVVNIFESASTFAQLPMRKLCMFRSGLLEEIMCDCEQHFSAHNSCNSRKLEEEAAKIMKIAKTIYFSLLIGCVSTLMSIYTIYGDSTDLPEICYIPNLPYAREILYITQIVLSIETCVLVGIFDGFYLLIIFDLIVQFRLLGQVIATVKYENHDENCLKMLKIAAEQHSQLLMIQKKLGRFYSKYFVVQYLVCITSLVVQLYTSSVADLGLLVLGRHMLYLIIVSFQLGLFFIPASFLSEEAAKFELAIYNSKWYLSDNIEIRQHVRFMLMKAQQPVVLTGADLFPINKNQFLTAFRLSYSITTLLRNAK